jgi:RND family efflux transporter MFP subunit
VNNAELNVQTTQNDLQTLLAGPDANDIRIAQESVRQAEAALAQLRQGPTDEQVAAAQATLVQAQSSLADLQAGPDTLDIQQAELTVRQAEAKLEQSRLNLAKATLTAPFAGVVTAVNVIVGQTVGASSNPIQLADVNNLQIETQVSELDRVKLKVGQTVNIKLEALTGVTLQGEIVRINPTGTSASGVVNYGVVVKVTRSDPNAAAGMTATLSIVTESKQGVLLVPNRAIQTVNGQKTVTVVRDGTTVLIPVTTGVTDGSKTEISSPDLKEGDEVVSVTASTTTTTSSTQTGPGMNPMGILGGGPPPPGR